MTPDRRDGSLLRRKREQWAREKAEEANNNWFPFGSPGGGTPNRKFESIEYTTVADSKNTAKIPVASSSTCQHHANLPSCENHTKEISKDVHSASESIYTECIPPLLLNHQIRSSNQELNQSTNLMNSPHQQIYPLAFGFNPFSTGLGSTSIPASSSMSWGYPYPIPLSFVPPGTKPISLQNSNNAMPDSVCVFSLATNNTEAQMTYWKQPVFPVEECRLYPNTTDIPPNRSVSVSENNYEGLHYDSLGVSNNILGEQIKEKSSSCGTKISEHSNSDELEVNEPNHCCNEKKQTTHEVDNEEIKEKEKVKRQQMLAEALEKAKTEAEVMRKARLYHHVLKAADGSPELEKKYLGVDSETVHKIQHELAVMDRHKLLLREELVKSLPKNKNKNNDEVKLKCMSHSQTANFTYEEGYSCSEKHTASVAACVSRGKSSVVRNGIENSRVPTTHNTNSHLSEGEHSCCEKQTSSLHVCASNNSFTTPGNSVQNPEITSTPITRNSLSRRNSQMSLPFSTFSKEPNRRCSQDKLYTSNNFPGKNRTKSAEISVNPLFSPILTRSRQKKRVLTDSMTNMSNRNSLESQESENDAQSLIPKNIDNSTVDHTKTILASSNTKQVSNRTPLRSPIWYIKSSEKQLPLCSSVYARKIAEKGCDKHDEDILSPDLRRVSEVSLSRAPSLQNLRGSFSNLSLHDSANNLDMNGEESSNLGRFRSLNPTYRSFNMKKTSDKQQEVLDRLNKLRKQLRSKENFMERGVFSRQQQC